MHDTGQDHEHGLRDYHVWWHCLMLACKCRCCPRRLHSLVHLQLIISDAQASAGSSPSLGCVVSSENFWHKYKALSPWTIKTVGSRAEICGVGRLLGSEPSSQQHVRSAVELLPPVVACYDSLQPAQFRRLLPCMPVLPWLGLP